MKCYINIVIGIDVCICSRCVDMICIICCKYNCSRFEVNYFIRFDINCGIINNVFVLVFN